VLPGLLGGTFDPSLNFATGGALTGSTNLNSNRPSLLPGSDLTGIVLPGIETQVDGFLADGGTLDADDLVIVYGGANDVFAAADTAATLPADQIPALVQTTAANAAGNIATSVGKLASVGGGYFILPNLPDIGSIPSFTAGGADSIALGSSFTNAHNLALGQAAVGLQDQTGANVIVFDVNGILADIEANPDRYGISNTTDACIDTIACITGDTATQNTFLYFDGVHPTAGVHAQVAQILATTVRAPTTVAAQGDVTLAAASDFHRAMIESLNPVAATASVSLGAGQGAKAHLDTADLDDDDDDGSDHDRPTDLFVLIDRTDGDRDERGGALGHRYDVTSLTAGVRHHVSEHFALGGAARFGAGKADIDGGLEDFNHRQAQLGLSATVGDDQSYIMGLVGIGYAEIDDIERRTGISGVVSKGSTDGFLLGAGVSAGHLIDLGHGLRLGPIGSFRYSAVDLDGYVENGPAFLNQRVERQKGIRELVASVGTSLELGWGAGETDDVRLRLRALLEHDFEKGDRTIASSFVTGPTTLATTLDARDQTTGRLGADVGFSLTGSIELGAGYETLIGSNQGGEHSVFGRAVVSF
jgi:outer membrane lipase/esterase